MNMSILAALALLAAASPADPDVNGLGWMTGCWEQRDGERWTEECWTKPRGGMMFGSSRTGRGETIIEWEALRIERNAPNGDGPIVKLGYFAAPGGGPWKRFAWSRRVGPGITFYNVANDYPQRIRYWREGAALIAEIALEDGSKARRWRYRRIRD
jgi:hypothetical protein